MENKKTKLLCICVSASQHFQSMQCISNEILNMMTSDSSDGTDSEDEEIVKAAIALKIKFEANRIEGFIEKVVSNHSECEFQSHFRLTTKAFEFLLSKVAQNIDKANTGRTMIDIKKQLLAVIWILANPECYRSVGERFDLAKSTLSCAFFRVVNALNKLAAEFIRWPTETEMNDSRLQFELVSGIKNCIGAIDGTYIAVKAPKEQAHCYINRKKFHSITLQAICDYRMKFFDCSVGYPSSVHDARIFRNSAVYKKLSYFG